MQRDHAPQPSAHRQCPPGPRRRTAGVLLLGALCSTLTLVACERLPREGEPLPINIKFGEGGDSPGQFAYPRAIDADATSVWVIDKLARVQRLDAKTGTPLGGWRMPQWQLGKPTGVTVWAPNGAAGTSSDEFIFVPDTHYHRVCIYQVPRVGRVEHEDLVAQFGEYGTGPGQFIYTTDVMVIPNAASDGVRRLYVSEYGGNDRISIFERKNPDSPGARGDYQFVNSFGKFGIAGEDDADGSLVFNRPQSIELNAPDNEIIVNDACNHRVGRLTLDGKLIAWYGCSPSSPRASDPALANQPRLSYPYGLELPGDGTALIAEFGGSRLHRVNLANGASLGTYGKTGRKDGELLTPWGVTMLWGDSREVFALDSGSDRVEGFTLPKANMTNAPRTPATSTPGQPIGGAPR